MEFCRDKQRSAEFHPLVNPDMGHKSEVLWQFKARILVWLIVMVFSIWLIDMGQYFELPFGSCITSRFSAGNISSNMTIFNDLNSKEVQRQTVLPENSSSKTNVSAPKGGLKQPAVVVSISEMNDLLLQSRASLRNWSEREI